MSTLVDVSRRPSDLTGTRQKAAITIWAVLFALSLLSFALSLISFNIWDRVPAANLPAYFHDMTQEAVTAKTALQEEVVRMGFSLASFAYLFTAFRLIGNLSLFALSALIIWRYSHHLMAVLLAGLLAVMGAGGIWNHPLFGASSSFLTWMAVPAQILNILLWFGLILLYLFPDGRFAPRWTWVLVLFLIPIVISLVFDLPIFFNPNTWPEPLQLLPNLVFIGLAFFSILYRYTHTPDPDRKKALRGFTLGVSLLLVVYFIIYFLDTVPPTVAQVELFSTIRSVLVFTLISEGLWYVMEVVFVLLTYHSIFRDRLFEHD